jgi:hypothetical protein
MDGRVADWTAREAWATSAGRPAQGLSVAGCGWQPTPHLEDRAGQTRLVPTHRVGCTACQLSWWRLSWRCRWLIRSISNDHCGWWSVAVRVAPPGICSTFEAIETDEQAWQVVFAYMRRWQIELSWKYEKSELAFQSPRVYEGEPREKLLLLATLAYAFLLTLLQASYEELRLWLLRSYCHRTGIHCRTAKLPLTRLRCAERPLVARPPS